MKRLQILLRRIVLLFFGSTILAVLIYKWCPVYVTPLMFIRCFQQVGRGETLRLKHHWVPLDSMSLYMPVAVMASEDQRFLTHNGFDFIEINKTIEERRSGRRFRGGSTISQQTAKNVFLWPGASWLRKGLEAYFTILIEYIWGKERIMHLWSRSRGTATLRLQRKAPESSQLCAHRRHTSQSAQVQQSESFLLYASQADCYHATNAPH